ncbi:MAG: uroporphyrinogen decarboxylase [Helicobacter sp.]|nr:uroporphyrinogen decarboxylase [Helicobacter sp.]
MIFIDACKRLKTPYTPVWFMRQAGRYLSEYQAARKEAGSFLELCENVDLITKVSLQPVEILDVDAAIIFSDILLVPREMGLPLEFIEGQGPVFSKTITDYKSVGKMRKDTFLKMDYVYDSISQTRAKLPKEKALIGFVGSPWTLATYMIEGQSSKHFQKAKKVLYESPQTMHFLLKQITDELKGFIEGQIKAGADAIMIFDTWANALEREAFFEFSFGYIKDLIKHARGVDSSIPLIVFPKGVGAYLPQIDGDFDVFGVDWSTPLDLAKKTLGSKYVLQGNLEPSRLYNEDSMEMGVDEIIDIMGKKEGHIFNLGHGMLPDLPRENVKKLVEIIKRKTKR